MCNYFRYWGPDNARVVCRQLHFSEEGIELSLHCYITHMHFILHGVTIKCLLGTSIVSASIFGASSRPFVVGEVHCTGSETELLECSHNSIGRHFCWFFFSNNANDVAIECGMFSSLHHRHHKYTHNSIVAENY